MFDNFWGYKSKYMFLTYTHVFYENISCTTFTNCAETQRVCLNCCQLDINKNNM